ncbi:MAG: tetratricopeptide repeat protein [Bryobacteraceae bacterium]
MPKWTLAALAITVLAATWFSWPKKSAPAASPSARYAPASACLGCHVDISKTYRETGMGRAFSAFRFDRTTADFTTRNRFHHAPSERYYTMIRRGDEAFLRRHQVGPAGEEINVVEKRIDYIMGSGHAAQTLIHRTPRGELIELPVAWYVANSGGYWAMNPNYDRPDHEDFRRRISYDCFFCHDGYPDLAGRSDSVYADPIYPTKLPEGIDCQRCHGPGQAHVDAMGKAPILNPKRLGRDQRMEICLQCHLQSTSRLLPHATVKLGRGVFSFRAGEPLRDYMLHWDHPSGAGLDDKFEIAHSAYRLRQSQCFRKSEMTCLDCHNPHRKERGAPAIATSSAACKRCHAAPSPAAHAKVTECVSCHMPRRRTEDVVQVVMVDHKIVRRPQAGDLTAPRSEDRGAPYRGRVAAYYPLAPDAFHAALAQVRTGTNLPEGVPALEAAVKASRDCADCWYELADAYGRAKRGPEAIQAAEQALHIDAGHLPAMKSLGSALSASGELARGAELLERALATSPVDPRLLHDLGENLVRQGRLPGAIARFRQALTADPDSPEIHFALGSALHSSGNAAEAEREFLEAIRAQPDFGSAHLNAAILISQRGDARAAEYHFRQAVRWAPTNPQVRSAFAAALMRQERSQEAIEQFREAAKLDPRNDEAQLFLGVLLAERGQPDAAEHLRIAAASANSEIRDRAQKALAFLRAR